MRPSEVGGAGHATDLEKGENGGMNVLTIPSNHAKIHPQQAYDLN